MAIPYTESYQSLEKKVVDAVLTAPAAALIFKLNEVTPYMSTAYFISASHGFAINLKTWIENLERLKELDIEWILPGHGALSKPDIIDSNILFLMSEQT